MRILVFGVNGQVGQEFCGLDTNHEIIPVARAQADLSLSGVAKQIIAREKNPIASLTQPPIPPLTKPNKKKTWP